jgi:hypothetical protein
VIFRGLPITEIGAGLGSPKFKEINVLLDTADSCVVTMEGPSYLLRLCVGVELEGHLVDSLVRKAQFTHPARDFKSPKAVISKIQDRMSSINNYKQLK